MRGEKTVLSACLFVLCAADAALGEDAKRIDIDATDRPLAAVVEYLRAASGANIVLGPNRDGKPIAEDETLRITLQLEAVPWNTILKLAAEQAGVLVEAAADGIWRVYQPPRYVLHLVEADLGLTASTIAALGNLNIVFDQALAKGRTLTLRLSNLPWERALDVAVRSVGLVLVSEAGGARGRIVEPEMKPMAAFEPPDAGAATAPTKASPLRLSAVLFRRDGGKNLVVLEGKTILEGEEKLVPLAGTGKTARVRLEKVEEDGSAVLSVDGERRVAKAGAGRE